MLIVFPRPVPTRVFFQNLFQRRPRRRYTDRLDEYASEIRAGFLFQGHLTGSGNYLLEGEIIGNGEIAGAVIIAAQGCWTGDIQAEFVRVAGRVLGNIVASRKIELAATAQVFGDMTAPAIAIADGAIVEGNISRPRKTIVTRHNERRTAAEPA